MHSARRCLASLLLSAALSTLHACSPDDPDTAQGAVVTRITTRWTLARVDGQALPRTVTVEADAPVEVVAGRLSLDADGTWTFRYDQRTATPEGAVYASGGATGTWEPLDGEPLYMRLLESSTQETFLASWPAATVVDLQFRGHRYRFARAD